MLRDWSLTRKSPLSLKLPAPRKKICCLLKMEYNKELPCYLCKSFRIVAFSEYLWATVSIRTSVSVFWDFVHIENIIEQRSKNWGIAFVRNYFSIFWYFANMVKNCVTFENCQNFPFLKKNEITLEQKAEWAWNFNCHNVSSFCKAWSKNTIEKLSKFYLN